LRGVGGFGPKDYKVGHPKQAMLPSVSVPGSNKQEAARRVAEGGTKNTSLPTGHKERKRRDQADTNCLGQYNAPRKKMMKVNLSPHE